MGANQIGVIWTLESAVDLVRQLEWRLQAHGWHVALAGSVLHKGVSDHDLDLVIFPHDTTNKGPLEEIAEVFRTVGYERTHTAEMMRAHWRKNARTDNKHVESYRGFDKRIDIIILTSSDVNVPLKRPDWAL